MARFLVRIELNGASSAKYEELHKAMEKVGFKHNPPPTGEYQNDNATDITVEEMKVKLVAVVDKVHKPNSGLIAKGPTAWWWNAR